MNRLNTRAKTGTSSDSSPHVVAKRTRSLLAMVGRALGLAGAGPSMERMDGQPFESLEQRALLEGSFATAITINLANPQSQGNAAGVINPAVNSTDNDFYTFVAPADDFLTVLGDTANESATSSLNTRVTVYGSASLTDVIATGTNNGTLSSGSQRDGWAGFVAQAGRRYYVVVSSDYPTGPLPNLSTGNTYTLRVDGATSKFEVGQDTGIGRENGTLPPGNPTPPLRPIQGRINLRQQDVVFEYTAPVGPGFDSLVTLNAQYTNYAPANLPGSSIPDRLDTRLEVYDSNSTLIASDSDAGRLNDAFLSFYAQQGETYYIRVRSDEVRPRDPNDPLFDLSLATGPFFLVLDGRSTDVTINPVTRRATEINGTFTAFGNPTVAPIPAIANPVFQTDSYNFTSQGDGLTIITVNPAGLAPVSDPALRLYDDQGNLLAFNDNFGGTSPQIAINLVGGRRYFVVVDGFEINSQVQYTLDIESNHTNDPGAGLDDHVNTPTLPQNPSSTDVNNARAAFEQATGLVWGDPTRLLDADNNPLRDRAYVTTATGTGRLQGQGDTDLFQFTPQVDMQLDFMGQSDDATSGHQALYIGGRFNRSDVGSVYPVDSRGVTVWDASDYFYAGNQSFDPNFGVTYGFRDNPATAGTTQAEIYVQYDWTVGTASGNTSHILVVGGDFELVIPTAQGPALLTNLAAWAWNPTDARWEWSAVLGSPNAPVRAVTTYDPPAAMMGGPGTGNQDLGLQLVIGGDFTAIGATGANRLAFRDANNINIGWAGAGAGIGNGSVNALTVYDPQDPGSGDSGNGIPDPPDAPSLLIVGGSFTGTIPAGRFAWDTAGGAIQNIAISTLGNTGRLFSGNPNGTNTSVINGPVFALAVTNDPIGSSDGSGNTPGPTLFIGGQFTVASGRTVSNLVAWGQVPDQAGTRPANVLGWAPLQGGGALPGGANTSVRALTVWDAPDINNTTINPVLVIGGQFIATGANSVNPQNNIITWTGAAFNALLPAGNGTNGIVRSLATVVDAQEPSIEANLRTGNPQQVLYVGGDFTTVSNNVMAAPIQAAHVAQFSAFRGQTADFFQWARLAGGVGYVNTTTTPIATVFSLASFNDANPTQFDRHDRPASRLAVTLIPVDGSFVNTRVRILDSNFNVVYGFDRPGSDTIVPPPFTDPSGMVDPSRSTPTRNTQFDGITVWGGEVYYLEVSDLTNTGTGRYAFSVVADALPPDVNGDGLPDQANGTFTTEANEGQFGRAQTFITNAAGDAQAVGNIATPPPPGFGPQPTSFQIFHVNPSTGVQLAALSDLGNISTVNDTDLFSFRAESTGFAELRVSTAAVPDQFGQYTFANGAFTFQSGTTKTYESRLDSVIRVFRNDFEQIGYNDDSGVVVGTRGSFPNSDPNTPGDLGTNVGVFNDVIFNRDDARVVVPVVAGNIYYVQVESANRYSSGQSGVAANRTPTIARERDVRSGTGGYRLFINAMPAVLDTDIENGVPVQDDHFDLQNAGSNGRALDALATPIDIGDNIHGINGFGSATGIINNTPRKASDIDLFTFIAPGDGAAVITVTPGPTSVLSSSFQLINSDPNSPSYGAVVATSSPLGSGVSRVQAQITKGARFIIAVSGGGSNTEGAYTVSISGLPIVDDYADAFKLWNAQDVLLRDFLGQGQITGRINSPGDTDIFRYSFNDAFTSMTVNVTSSDPTLRPTVTVYEINEDFSGNPVLLRIGFNNNAAGTASTQTTVPLTPNRTTLPANGPARTYPFYYIAVQGLSAGADTGNYTLTVSFPATDDHADGDTNADGTLDTGEFPFASRIIIDPTSGEGQIAGVVERASDSDLFQFTSPASGPTTIDVTRAPGSLLRQRVTLLGADGSTLSVVTAPDATTPATQSITFNTVRDVTYYLVVQPFEDPLNPNINAATTGAYNIVVQTPPVDDYPNIGEFSIAAALQFDRVTGQAAIGGNAAGDSSNAFLNPSSDTDLFTFTPLLAGNQAITVTPFNGAFGNLQARIRVFQQVGANYVELADVTGSGPGQSATFNLNATSTSSVYFVLVSGASGAVSPNTTGEYRVQVQGPVPTGETGGGDVSAIDFNNAGNIPLNTRTGAGQTTDSISPAGDRDVFTFRSLAAGQAFVQLVAPNGSLLRASVRVLNAPNENAGSEVAFDSQGIPGAIANTAFTATANTQYWVVVDGLGDSVGSYTVRVIVPPSVYQLVYPEGFANDNIAEFVSLVNPNNAPATYSIYLRYEWGDTLELLADQGTLPANARGGLTIQDRNLFRLPGLQTDIPYSVIVQSNLPLGATLAHYDLGGSLGDSFSSVGSSEWTFSRVERTVGVSADFTVFYNLNNFDVNVTLTAYQDGQTFNVATQTVAANRRGGWDINNAALASLLPRGVFAVKLTATPVNAANLPVFQGIVASLSHYNVATGTAFGLLGDPNGGATTGILTNITQGPQVNSEIVLFNPSGSAATITLSGTYITANLPSFNRQITLAPNTQLVIPGSSLGLIPDQAAGVVWRSNQRIVVSSNETQLGDGDSTQPATSAGTRFFFGDAYINPPGAGTLYFENVFLGNPTTADQTVAVKILFVDSTTATFNVNVPANGFAQVRLHERPEILNKVGSPWFSLDLTSALPFVASMQHYDLSYGGGWATSGVPLGFVQSLDTILI